MNLLQSFMVEANVQARVIVAEEFRIVGEDPQPDPLRVGTFGNPTVIPIMTRQGYQDHLVTIMTAEKSLFATLPAARSSILRVQTNRTLFVQAVDTTHPVIYTFTLTDREL